MSHTITAGMKRVKQRDYLGLGGQKRPGKLRYSYDLKNEIKSDLGVRAGGEWWHSK